MFTSVPLTNILFIDIETAPCFAEFNQLTPELQTIWSNKISKLQPEDTNYADIYLEKAGLYPEFGKIICISAGFFIPKTDSKELILRIKSFFENDEKELLTNFFLVLKTFFSNPPYKRFLCGHNLKEFDIPYLIRRGLIHRLSIPSVLDVNALKPWETPFIDTLQIWKFGDYKSFISLELICLSLNIPNPKAAIKGADVAEVYWHKNNLQQICHYCQQDVIAIARLMQLFKNKEIIKEKDIVFV